MQSKSKEQNSVHKYPGFDSVALEGLLYTV